MVATDRQVRGPDLILFCFGPLSTPSRTPTKLGNGAQVYDVDGNPCLWQTDVGPKLAVKVFASIFSALLKCPFLALALGCTVLKRYFSCLNTCHISSSNSCRDAEAN